MVAKESKYSAVIKNIVFENISLSGQKVTFVPVLDVLITCVNGVSKCPPFLKLIKCYSNVNHGY